jgi:hypothetical protein
MRLNRITMTTLLCLSAISATTWAAPEDGAAEQYRAYVSAVRTGKLDDVVKLVEPVPATSKPMLTARIKQAIAVEAMQKEMVAQMGPAKSGEEGWAIGGLPYDDVLKDLKPVAQDANTVALQGVDPASNTPVPVGWIIRRNGKWLVPAGLVLDLEPAPQFVEPEAAERAEKIKDADAMTKAADVVLQRLKKKEFKKPAEVQSALAQELRKASEKQKRG